jgi:2-amino-4-hydroxy-6-hydroxymethyldihydropteridine diphosphokinase
MEQVIVAVGSNLGDRLEKLRGAATFLDALSDQPVVKSSIWESEPIGPSEFPFLNAVARITVSCSPAALLDKLKQAERDAGRKDQHIRWGPRPLDLDIIAFGDLVIQTETLIIPHPEYTKRMFVLCPLQEVAPNWNDPSSGKPIDALLEETDSMQIHKTNMTW